MKTLLLFLAAAVGAASVAADPVPQVAGPTVADTDERSGWLDGRNFVHVCFHGLQGGKVVVASGQVHDDQVETTAKACRIDGGHQRPVPKSPIIPAGSAAVG